ncbi:cell division protein ZapA [Algicola sagamiensis]|uniref:cell division protein ZapA n=1 Tax=Algicola sagamiensis TaxID=163869 RepID=UPI000361B333|nr:cell division protein ZapA [Algicola sagamiensis]
MTTKAVTISILGKTYKVNCPKEKQLELRDAVAELERRISETQQRSMLHGIEGVLIMTALNMSHELLEQQALLELLDEQTQPIAKKA